MPAFNFEKNTKLALVVPGSQVYEVFPENGISFGQTFTEQTSSVNTVHSPQYFERSTIVKANPASFSFTVNLLKESPNGAKVVYDRLLAADAFHLYFIADESTFKLQNCVITNGSFLISRDSLLKLEVEGEAERLIRSASDNTANTAASTFTSLLNQISLVRGTTPPASAPVTDPDTRFANLVESLSESFVSSVTFPSRIIPKIEVVLDSSDITDSVFGISAELQNSVEWTGYETVNAGLAATDNSNAMYPSGYTIDKKIFSGNIRQYLEDGSESTFLNFDTDVPLRIKAGNVYTGALYTGTFVGLDFNMANVSYTNRVTAGSLYTQSFDWRLTQNTTLSSILQYNTI